MGLEQKSITELRGMAQAIGVKIDFGYGKARLIELIGAAMLAKLPKAPDPVPVVPEDQRLRTVPPAKNCEQYQVEEALKPWIDKGLRLSFPKVDEWRMEFLRKHDTGTMRMPLRVIIGCARDVMTV